jgi:hypothetical protein
MPVGWIGDGKTRGNGRSSGDLTLGSGAGEAFASSVPEEAKAGSSPPPEAVGSCLFCSRKTKVVAATVAVLLAVAVAVW